METKKCSKCGEVKELSAFLKRKNVKSGLYNRCRCCENERIRLHRKRNPEKDRMYWKKYRDNNTDKILIKNKTYRENHPEKVSELSTYHIESLSCSYISKLLKLSTSECPPELIELKREQIKLHRFIKELESS